MFCFVGELVSQSLEVFSLFLTLETSTLMLSDIFTMLISNNANQDTNHRNKKSRGEKNAHKIFFVIEIFIS